MILFFSGGSAIPETCLNKPTVMLSYFVNVSQKTGKVDKRLRDILKAIKKTRLKKKRKKK